MNTSCGPGWVGAVPLLQCRLHLDARRRHPPVGRLPVANLQRMVSRCDARASTARRGRDCRPRPPPPGVLLPVVHSPEASGSRRPGATPSRSPRPTVRARRRAVESHSQERRWWHPPRLVRRDAELGRVLARVRRVVVEAQVRGVLRAAQVRLEEVGGHACGKGPRSFGHGPRSSSMRLGWHAEPKREESRLFTASRFGACLPVMYMPRSPRGRASPVATPARAS